ncbi:MAG: RNA polymerase sigma factor [Myxococcales bacterium]|nr:RNA polymerase sigma factor [Myxococcales bacterium]
MSSAIHDLPPTELALGSGWLEGFHAGDREALEAFYRGHFATVDRAVGQILAGADRETVVHEVFFRVLSQAELRRQLNGGSPAAWIAAVARNHAIDYRRRRDREIPDGSAEGRTEEHHPPGDGQAAAHLLLERFCHEVLPDKWRAVFDACFVRQLTQRDAARELGISRTTLLYQQHRVRALLRSFSLEVE